MKKTICELHTELFELIRYKDMHKLKYHLKRNFKVDSQNKLTQEQLKAWILIVRNLTIQKEI